MVASSNQTFNIVSELRSLTANADVIVQVMGLLVSDDGNGGEYRWNTTSTATDDGFITIKVTGVDPGRWLRVGNSNTLKGSATFSGLTLQTAYVINYKQDGTALPFTPKMVLTEARSAGASVARWVTNINATSFTINFGTVPILGTNNLIIDYVIIKQ